jgi:hypothetical protein
VTHIEELQEFYSDFHKDFYGFRPRNMTPEQWNSAVWLETAIEEIQAEFERVASTELGRVRLRVEGWNV